MIRSNTKKGTRVIINAKGLKTDGRQGTLIDGDAGRWTTGLCSVRLDATSTQPAINITIKREKVEVL